VTPCEYRILSYHEFTNHIKGVAFGSQKLGLLPVSGSDISLSGPDH